MTKKEKKPKSGGKDLTKAHVQLSKLFYGNRGLFNQRELIRNAKKKGIKLSQSKIREWYKSQPINQVFTKADIKGNQKRIYCPFHNVGCLQMDLLVLTKFNSRINGGYKYLLNIVDVYSRYVWSFPLKTKRPKEVLPGLVEVVNTIKNNYNSKTAMTFTMDDGGEFKGVVKKYLKDNKYPFFIANPKDNTKQRNMIVERFHRTFWNKLKKMLLVNNNNKWIEAYEDIIDNYNKTTHSILRVKPYDVFWKKQRRNLKPYFVKKEALFEIGDTVRVLRNRKQFEKASFSPVFTIKTYKIVEKVGQKYKVGGRRETFFPRELLKATDGKVGEVFVEEQEQEKAKQKQTRARRKTGLDVVEGEIVAPVKPRGVQRRLRRSTRLKGK